MQKQTAKMKSMWKTGYEEPGLKKSILEKSQRSKSMQVNGLVNVLVNDDVAVMTSPKVDVSRRRMARGGAWRHVTETGGAWSAWAFAQNILVACEGVWELRWWSGFHERVDWWRKILVVPAKKHNRSKDHGGDGLAVVSRLWMTTAAGPKPETMTEMRQRFNDEWLQ